MITTDLLLANRHDGIKKQERETSLVLKVLKLLSTDYFLPARTNLPASVAGSITPSWNTTG